MPAIDLDAHFLALREAFAPVLRERMEEILEEVKLLEPVRARLLIDALEAQYRSGEGGPEEWMDSYLARFRIAIAGDLHREDDAATAAQCLLSEDLRPEQALEALKGQAAAATDPRSRSIFRSARANLLYREGRIKEAVECLEEEADDPELPAVSRRAAQVKIDALAGLSEPVGWEEELIPPEWREGDNQNAWAQMTGEGLGGREGDTAGNWYARTMSRRGHIRRALRVCDKLMEHQEDESGTWSLKASVLRDAGWPDLAVWSCPAAGHTRRGIFETYGFQDLLCEDFRRARGESEGTEYCQNHHGLIRALAEAGRFEEALRESEIDHPPGTLTPLHSKLSALDFLHSAPCTTDQQKEKICELTRALINLPEFETELEELSRRRNDESLSKHDRKLADHEINRRIHAVSRVDKDRAMELYKAL